MPREPKTPEGIAAAEAAKAAVVAVSAAVNAYKAAVNGGEDEMIAQAMGLVKSLYATSPNHRLALMRILDEDADGGVVKDELLKLLDRLTPGAFKKHFLQLGWTGVSLAGRWEMTLAWLTKIANNPDRSRHWEDALHGLPRQLPKKTKRTK